MPSSTRFSISEADAPESPWQGPLDDSDFESLCDNRKGGRSASKMYWLGKILLRQMLAMQVYSQNSMIETGDELDAILTQAYANYPWRDVLKRLSPSQSQMSIQSVDGNSGALHAFVTRLADAFLHGGPEANQRLTLTVQEGLDNSNHSKAHQPATQDHILLAGRTATPMETNDVFPTELSRFTIALKEYGDRTGSEIKWTTKHLSTSPMRWQAVAIVSGQKFQSTGRNTKEAKHKASKNACESLEIAM